MKSKHAATLFFVGSAALVFVIADAHAEGPMSTEACGADASEVYDEASGERICAPHPDVTCAEDTELAYSDGWYCAALEGAEEPPEDLPDDEREAGLWSKYSNKKGEGWTHFNVVCFQKWLCNPKQAMLTASTTKVRTTGLRSTTGVCTATRFDPKCGSCLSNEPDTACEVWLERE